MAKITRYNGNLVAPASAALGTERTIFGTAGQSDDLTDQFNADLLRGWGIVGPSDQPTLQDFNAMGFTLGQIHAYLHQMGVAEYNAAQEYHLGSITNVAGVLYVSLVNNNIGNTPASSPAQWSTQSDHGMIVLTTTQSWAVPAAMQLGYIKPKVTVVGGGGGGGTPGSSGFGGGGGGGGGTGSSVINLTGVTTVSVTIGAGGAAGSGGGNGGSGGSSSFGAYITANGGSGGRSLTLGDAGEGAAAGTGGSINSGGSAGTPGFESSFGGSGGSSTLGGGGRSGEAGRVYGGGGGGAPFGGAVGFAGAQGVIVIEW